MEFVGNNVSMIVQLAKGSSAANLNPLANNFGSRFGQPFINDPACSTIPDIFNKLAGIDLTMDNVAAFQDVISVAQDGLGQMQTKGERIRELIEKAKEEGCTEETLNELQAEVNKKIAEIHEIRANTNFNGINPYDGALSLGIPNWHDIFGVDEENEDAVKNEITDMLASFDIDMDIDAGFFKLGGTATINIGYTEDGSLQITVDTAFDFDLSALENMGIQDENAMDIINNFLALLTGQQQGMGNASNIINNLFASASASIQGDGFSIDATNDINMTGDDSKSLQGQIVQHAAITLANTTNFAPSIAINIL